MRRLSWLILLMFCCATRTLAIQAVVSHSVFYIPDSNYQNSKAYVEMYWQFNPQSLHYMRTPEKTLIAAVKTRVTLTTDSGIVKEDFFVFKTPPMATEQEVFSHSIIDLHRYYVPAGLIKMKVEFVDVTDSTNKYTFTDTFTVAPPSRKGFYGDIQLLDTSYVSSVNDIFQKNNKIQVPLCANFFDDNRNTLHYYIELYDVPRLMAEEYPLIQTVYIAKTEDEGIYPTLVRKDTIKSGPISLTYGDFKLGVVPSGNYHVCVKLENNLHMLLADKTLFFQRFNSHPEAVNADTSKAARVEGVNKALSQVNVIDLGRTFIAKYNSQQIRAILKMILPLVDASGEQTIRGWLKKPDELYMRYYIYNYFAAVNPKNPEKAWDDFTVRIKDVNKHFNTGTTPGYETERGMIYLKYGPPDNRETVENEPGAYPYEVWQYNQVRLLNGKTIANGIFLFYRPGEITFDYQLLHSTVPGELQNINWRSYLYTNGNSTSSQNSRVEQYFSTAHGK